MMKKRQRLDIAKAVEEGVNPLVIVEKKRREVEMNLKSLLGRSYSLDVCKAAWIALEEYDQMSMIQKGKMCLAIKEAEGKETFLKVCEEVGVSYRRAYEYIAFFVKFGNHPEVAKLGDSKLRELQSLSEEDIQKLEKGKLLDKSVDDIELMTVAELRELVRKRKESDKNLRTHNNNLKARNALLEERLKDKDRIDEAVKSDLFAMHLRLMDAMGDFTKALASAPEEMRNDWAKKLFTGLLGHWNQMIAFCGAEIRPYYTQQMTERNFRPATEEETVVDEARKEYPLE